jgi:hypothetical protein
VAGYADQILRGRKPGEIPFEFTNSSNLDSEVALARRAVRATLDDAVLAHDQQLAGEFAALAAAR